MSILVIAREDKEQSSGLAQLPREWIAGLRLSITDWHNVGLAAAAWSVARIAARVPHILTRARRRLPIPRIVAANLLTRGVLATINRINISGGSALYADARVAVVDRLHAHVMATLLGVDNVLLDNNYGKLGAVFDDYTHGFSNARYSQSIDHARAEVTKILSD
jgi:pyruvyl transferase EpsO